MSHIGNDQITDNIRDGEDCNAEGPQGGDGCVCEVPFELEESVSAEGLMKSVTWMQF
jgi:hypothetical protein